MQTITTPNGETLVVLPLEEVVLPLEEYERLVDKADIVAGDKVKADIAAGRDEMAPDVEGRPRRSGVIREERACTCAHRAPEGR
jgi:hypothetical protein